MVYIIYFVISLEGEVFIIYVAFLIDGLDFYIRIDVVVEVQVFRNYGGVAINLRH